MLHNASHSRLTWHYQFTDENILTLRHSMLYLAHFGPELVIVTTSLENVITFGVIAIDSWLGLTIDHLRAPSDVCQAVSIMGGVTVTTGDHWGPGVISPSHVTAPARTRLLGQKHWPIPRAGPRPPLHAGPITGHRTLTMVRHRFLSPGLHDITGICASQLLLWSAVLDVILSYCEHSFVNQGYHDNISWPGLFLESWRFRARRESGWKLGPERETVGQLAEQVSIQTLHGHSCNFRNSFFFTLNGSRIGLEWATKAHEAILELYWHGDFMFRMGPTTKNAT